MMSLQKFAVYHKRRMAPAARMTLSSPRTFEAVSAEGKDRPMGRNVGMCAKGQFYFTYSTIENRNPLA